MGSSKETIQQCSRSFSLLPSWPLLSLPDPQPMEPLLLMPQLRSSPLSLMLMSMESTMTTARLTSRRQKLKMPPVVSRPPPTMLTTRTDSLLRSHTRVPQSTPQSPPLDTDTLPLLTSQPVVKFQYILMKKPNQTCLLPISTKTDESCC